MRRIVLRTSEEKADADLSWSRPDEEFFASGACHVLAAMFLSMYPRAGFRACGVSPRAPHRRGEHVVVARDDLVFDWAGYSPRETFVAEYSEAMRTIFPDWAGDFTPINVDVIGWDFCMARNHRHPSQFRHDPLSRAEAFVRRFAPPGPNR